MRGGYNFTYRVDLPVLAADDVKLTADAILVVESARLNVARDHQVKGWIGWLVWVVYVHIVATDSQLIVGWVHTTGKKLFLKNFASKVYFLSLLRQSVSCIGHVSAACVVGKKRIGVLSNRIHSSRVSTVNAFTVLVGILIIKVKVVFAIGLPMLHIWRT